MVLDDNGGWSSGGFLSDSRVSGQLSSGTRQQWLSRNDQWGSWAGSNWNMVFVGDSNAPAQSFPNPPYTTVSQTPSEAEKPYLYVVRLRLGRRGTNLRAARKWARERKAVALFEMTDDDLLAVKPTTFVAEGILERWDLQRLLRTKIETIADDVLIVSEEFGAFDGARRRIDLLGVDHQGNLVVFELKRTDDGGHLELQALRYAAMISAMTLDDLSATYEEYLSRVAPATSGDARSRLAEWLNDGESAVISRHVRIVLVSAGFGREITTTVLWLTSVYALDIPCVERTPYKIGDRLFLDVRQVIPLPEAGDMTIKLQQKASQELAVRTANGRDFTRYMITGPGGVSEPLSKRQAVLRMVHVLHDAGIPATDIAGKIQNARFHSVEETLAGEELEDAFVTAYPRADSGRWFFDSPIHDDGRTWVVTKMWGRNTEPTLRRLAELAPPGSGIRFESVS